MTSPDLAMLTTCAALSAILLALILVAKSPKPIDKDDDECESP